MFKFSTWNIICILVFGFGAIRGKSSIMAVAVLLFFLGMILKWILRVE